MSAPRPPWVAPSWMAPEDVQLEDELVRAYRAVIQRVREEAETAQTRSEYNLWVFHATSLIAEARVTLRLFDRTDP